MVNFLYNVLRTLYGLEYLNHAFSSDVNFVSVPKTTFLNVLARRLMAEGGNHTSGESSEGLATAGLMLDDNLFHSVLFPLSHMS